MPTQYEQGPEAKAVESGFALDELLRRERGANARTMLGIAAQQRAAQQKEGFDREAAAIQQQYALDRMVKGEELKEQFAQKEAMRSAPALQALMEGNPDVAKIFGYSAGKPATIDRSGAMAEPEAAGIPAPISPAVPRRMPSPEEAAGLHRAVPGMAQALLQRGMEKANEKPQVVAPGSALVSPAGAELYRNPKDPIQTREQAEAIVKDIIERDPSKRGRVTIEQSQTTGGWAIKELPTESLVETPSAWLALKNDPLKPFNERVIAGLKYDQWKKDQIEIAGGKALEVARQTPYAGEAKIRLEAMNNAMQAAYRLQGYTAQEREQFTGAGKAGFFAARKAQELGLPTPGYSPEQVERYSEFVKDNGMVEQMKFAIGGKQLTEGEQRVVNAFVPTGREFTTAEYNAKLKGLVKAMEAAQAVDFWLSTVAKTDVSPEAIRSMYKAELANRGIDVTASKDEQVEQNMTSGQRLRKKYGQ